MLKPYAETIPLLQSASQACFAGHCHPKLMSLIKFNLFIQTHTHIGPNRYLCYSINHCMFEGVAQDGKLVQLCVPYNKLCISQYLL